MPKSKIKIGVSSCLLGEKVRYDAGDKKELFVTETLGAHFDLISVCPEMESGLGTPRESMQLRKRGNQVRIITHDSQKDLTARVETFARKKVAALLKLGIGGYVLKKNSPSCGMQRVKVYSAKGIPFYDGVGIFAKILMQEAPYLPVEEEGRLHDPKLRANWVERLFAYNALKNLFNGTWKLKELIDFHTRHKLSLMSHDVEAYRRLGREVAQAKGKNKVVLAQTYEAGFMTAFSKIATAGKNINVLQHMLGYLKNQLEPWEKQEMLRLIEEYRKGYSPLAAPLVMLSHYVEKFNVEYLKGQVYLRPEIALPLIKW